MRAAAGAAQAAARRPHTWTARLVQRHFGHDPAIPRWLWTHARPEHFDVALLYGAVTGQYIDAVRIPAVWDTVDELVLYTVRDAPRRGARYWLRTARAAALYAAFERHVARQAQATLFASPIDASYARRWAGGARVESISNGVDFEYFNGPTQPPEPGTLAFVGSLSFPPNVEGIVRFATRIWPRVQAPGAGQRLLIIGREPTDAVRALGRLPGVAVHANVPDVRPYLSQAAVVIVPTRLGGGVKNKVLEACAMQRPVVASPRALAGLTARRGRDILCASSTAAWVRHVTQVLKNPVAAAEIGRSGYHWVRRSHNWDCLAGQLTQMLASATQRGAR